MKRLAVSALLCVLLCGCRWRDAGDLSAVTAGAISQTQGDYTLTAELAVPEADSAVPSAQTVTGNADNIAQAIDRAGSGRDAQLYWSHARMLLLDETVLRDGIAGLAHALTLSDEVRPSVRLCAVRDAQADKVLTDSTSVSGDPIGFALGDSAEQAVNVCKTPDMPLYRVLDRVMAEGVDPVLPAVSSTDGQAVLSGTALFSGDTPCGWLDEAQTVVLCLLLQSGDTAALYDNGHRIELTDMSTRLSADTANHIAFTIYVKATVACENDGEAQRAAAALRSQCLTIVQTLQRTGCDALGLGRAWNRTDPTSYAAAADDAWRTAPVTVQVTLHDTQSGRGGST